MWVKGEAEKIHFLPEHSGKEGQQEEVQTWTWQQIQTQEKKKVWKNSVWI